MNHSIRNTALLFLWAIIALFLYCSKDYSPFTDPSNARVIVKHVSFHDQDTIGIFSTETLQVEVAARDLVDSFSVETSNNRLFGDSTVRARPLPVIAPNEFTFYFSIIDTGWQKVTVNTFKKTGEKTSMDFSLYCTSPLHQNAIKAKYYDSIDLSTTPVKDPDVLYHWDFGGGQTYEKTTPKTRVPIASFLSGKSGFLWVSDNLEKCTSPKTQFSFTFTDSSGPRIVCINNFVSNDTIQTGDSIFTFISRIIPLQNTNVVSASVSGQKFDVIDTDQEVYVKTYYGAAAFNSSTPLILQVRATDIFNNTSNKNYYVVFNAAIGRSSGTVISVTSPVLNLNDSALSSTKKEFIFGTIANYSTQPFDVLVRLRVNGTLQPTIDTVRLSTLRSSSWSFLSALNEGSNQLAVTAYKLTGDSCAAKNFIIVYDSTMSRTDSAAPVILDISAGGTHNLFTAKDSLVLRIIAVGQSTGIKNLTVNGNSLRSSPEALGYIWYDTVKTVHSLSAGLMKISALDSDNHETDTAVIVCKNRLPFIITPPNPSNPLVAGTAYRDSIVTIDPDGDADSVRKAFGPLGLSVSLDGYIRWTPTANDLGMQVLDLNVSDGYQSIAYNCTLFVVMPTTEPQQPVKFVTTLEDFPAYLEAGKDSLHVSLQTTNGTLPLQLSANVAATSLGLPIQNGVLQWKPSLADTGSAKLIVTVTDIAKKADTLLPAILIVPPNRPFTVSVSPSVPDSSIDLSKATGPDTVRFAVQDPDNRLVEQHTVKIIQSHIESVSTLDSSRSFMIILNPQHPSAVALKDTIEVIITDKAGHADSLTYHILYQAVSTTKKIAVNTTSGNGGAGVAAMVLKFPLLVRLDKTNFDFSVVNKLGAPLGFQKSDGSALPFEIERWDSAGGQAQIWVLADTVFGGDSTHFFIMNWSAYGPAPRQNSAAVFDTANGFQAVWHFNEGTNSIAQDATSNAYNGTPSGLVNDTIGVIGHAKVFNGQTSSFAMPNSANGKLNFAQNAPHTLSAWVNIDLLDGNFHCIISKSDHQYGLQIRSSDDLEYMEFDNVQGWLGVLAPVATQTWKYLVGVRNGTNEYLYIDGVLADATITVNSATGRDVSNDVAIGKLSGPIGGGGGGSRFFNGKIDEVSMANAARSADWIKLCFQNQKSGSTVVRVK
jgi:hypothetical protein